MSIFSSILEKLGFDHSEDASDTVAVPPVSAIEDEEYEDEEYEDEEYEDEEYEDEEDEEYEDEEEYEDDEITEVDVVAILEELAEENDEDLNWQVSIVDLLKLLDLDSSLSARKALARELKCPAKKMANSAQMNMWLHKTVLKKLAANGGNIPKDLLS